MTHRYMLSDVEAFLKSNNTGGCANSLWAAIDTVIYWYLPLIQLFINRRENVGDPVLKSALVLSSVS